MDEKTQGTDPAPMSNQDYVEACAAKYKNGIPAENRQAMLTAMDKYGENRWWLSTDKRIMAFWQLQEPIFLVDFDSFHEGIELLLHRPVWTHEFAYNMDGLKNEAANAILGLTPSPEEILEAIRIGMDSLYVNTALHGQTIIGIAPSEA